MFESAKAPKASGVNCRQNHYLVLEGQNKSTVVCDTVWGSYKFGSVLNGPQYRLSTYAQRLVHLTTITGKVVSDACTDVLNSLLAVLLLVFFLHLNLDIGWQVNNTRTAVTCNLIDVLSTSTRGVIDVDYEGVLDPMSYSTSSTSGITRTVAVEVDTALAFCHRNVAHGGHLIQHLSKYTDWPETI